MVADTRPFLGRMHAIAQEDDECFRNGSIHIDGPKPVAAGAERKLRPFAAATRAGKAGVNVPAEAAPGV